MSDSAPSSPANRPPPSHGYAMPNQQTPPPIFDTQGVINQLAAIFQPQLKDIKDQLANLITRREHEKDLAEITTDMGAHQRQLDRLQEWADKRPRESADVTWVKRIEADVSAINTRLAAQPAETRAWVNTLTSGGGCLYMILALAVGSFLTLLGIGVSVAIALAMRGG